MKGEASRTALGAAIHRALHQITDRPALLSDPYSQALLDPKVREALTDGRADEYVASQVRTRAIVVVRSLLAEETLATAARQGVDQYVLLGAGFDTFAYRNPYAGVRVFEVDHPATGGAKQAALAAAGMKAPSNVVYAPVDFERETLSHALKKAGFDANRPAVFAWLGVVIYLTKASILTTLRAVAAMAPGSEIVFEYGEPLDRLSDEARERMGESMERLSALGEPWISFFHPEEMAAMLRAAGFSIVEDISGAAINARWFSGRRDDLRVSATVHLMRAKV